MTAVPAAGRTCALLKFKARNAMSLARWLSRISCSLVLPAPTLPTSYAAWSQLRPYLLLMLPCPCSDRTYFLCSPALPAPALLTSQTQAYRIDPADMTFPRTTTHSARSLVHPAPTLLTSKTQANRIDPSDMTFPRTTSHPARSLALPAPTLLTNRIDPTT